MFAEVKKLDHSVNPLKDVPLDDKGEDKLDINDEKGSFAGLGSDFRRKTCFTPGCEAARYIFRWLTSVVAVLNNALDILYAYSTIYVSQSIFFFTCALLLIRVVGAIIISQYYYDREVRKHKFGMSKADSGVQEDKGDDEDYEGHEKQDERGRSMSLKDANFINEGKKLYGAFYIMFYVGLFRILPVRFFTY